MDDNIEFGQIKAGQKLGTLTIKTPNGNVKFEISGESKTVDLSSYATQQGSFMGNWSTFASIPSTVEGFTSEEYGTPDSNSFLIVQHDETHNGQISKYRYVGEGTYSKENWDYEFGIETNISLTDEQTQAINSGITHDILGDIQDRLNAVEQLNQDNIVQPIVDAVTQEAHTRNQQVNEINQSIQGIQSQMNLSGTMSRYNVQIMTQEEYDAIENRDPNTFYFITDEPEEETFPDEEL